MEVGFEPQSLRQIRCSYHNGLIWKPSESWTRIRKWNRKRNKKIWDIVQNICQLYWTTQRFGLPQTVGRCQEEWSHPQIDLSRMLWRLRLVKLNSVDCRIEREVRNESLARDWNWNLSQNHDEVENWYCHKPSIKGEMWHTILCIDPTDCVVSCDVVLRMYVW